VFDYVTTPFGLASREMKCVLMPEKCYQQYTCLSSTINKFSVAITIGIIAVGVNFVDEN
jgi:hypothetical protein